MRIHKLCVWLLPLSACVAPADHAAIPHGDPQAPATLVGRESDDPAYVLALMKAVIRRDAVTSYGADCAAIEIPDAAMIPVEITGGGLPELAVSFARVRCGDSASRFTGSGGVMVQFWIGSGGPVRLLLEQQMHGFTPAGDRLVTMQHGGFCPGGAGPDQCRVIYRWNDRDRRLEVVERRLASTLPPQPMTYDYAYLAPPSR